MFTTCEDIDECQEDTMRYVKYNGGTDSFYSSSNPSCLVKGYIYKVVKEEWYPSRCEYTLEGIRGHFNSVWFDDLPTYFAYVNKTPLVGDNLDVVRYDIEENHVSFGHYYTSEVKYLERLGYNTYMAVTLNTVYIVQVL